FGIEYRSPDPDWNFFAVELDRSTEDVEPTKNLQRSSWLRKILSYSAVSIHPHPVYESYLKVPNLRILCLFSDEGRRSHVMRLVSRYAKYPDQFLSKTISPVDPLLRATPLPQLFMEAWHSVSGMINISTAEGR